MAIYKCDARTDGAQREIAPHGTPAFPVACYDDDLRRDTVPWHWHDELEAGIITEGRVVVACGAKRHILGPGEGFFFNSGALHSFAPAEGEGGRLRSVVFHPRLVGGDSGSVFWEKYVQPALSAPQLTAARLHPRSSSGAEILECIESAWQLCTGESEGYEIQARYALSRLLFLLLRPQADPQPAPTERELRDSARMKAMLQFIHGHYGEDLRLAEIAGSAAISESECLRCFHATIRTTPVRYLRRYRIQMAAELLRAGGRKVSEVAALCGFQEMSYFARAFREEMGCTPSEYRDRGGEWA